MLKHGTILSTMEAISHLLPTREHRTVSLLPPSHLFDQGPIMFYGMMIGADILYVRSRNPRVIFDALREQRVTTMVVVPQMLELFWAGLQREIKRQNQERLFGLGLRIAPYLPYRLRRLLFRRLHRQLGGALTLFASAGAYLPPAVQRQWESLGIIVIQGYGATECGPISATTEQDHPVGAVGKTLPPVEARLDDKTSEILVRGPTVFPGYWRDPEATSAVMAGEWYRTGDVGHYDRRGNLVLSGRTKNIIVLPNGFNVFPEDIENVLHEVGLAQAVVLETRPGRIEAVVLSPDAPAMITAANRAPDAPSTPDEIAALRARIEPLIKRANDRLGQQQRLDDFRIWPEADFPRTHTLKIRRAEVQKWAAPDVPISLRDTPD
jgi:long-chain acyl-CoA synthetase